MSSPTGSAETSVFEFPTTARRLSDFQPPTALVAKLQVHGRPVLVVARDAGFGLRLLNVAVSISDHTDPSKFYLWSFARSNASKVAATTVGRGVRIADEKGDVLL